MTNAPFWNAVAASYRRIGPPLVPSDEDVRTMEDAIRDHAASSDAPRALLLGATPRLAELRWPDGTRLLGVDSSLEFVRAVWPGDIPGRRYGVQGDWRSLPVSDGAYDVAVGDGSLNCLRYPDGIRTGAAAVHRALGRRGLLVLRLYVRPDKCESPEELVQDAAAGRVDTFHQFRFRLLMALQRSVQEGIAVRDVHRYWREHRLPPESRPAAPGWRADDVAAIEPYRDSPAVHTFPTMTEWRSVIADWFDEIAVRPAAYVLGDRCPIAVWRSRS